MRHTGSKSKTLIASFGLLMSCCTCVADQMMGSGSFDPGVTPSAAWPAKPGTASKGLPDSHFSRRRRFADGSLAYVMALPLSVSLDLQRSTSCERREAVGLAPDEAVESLRRAALDLHPELLETAAHIGRLQRLVRSRVQLLDHGARRLRRGNEADPQRRVRALHALLGERRGVGQRLEPLHPRNAEDLEPARLDVA